MGCAEDLKNTNRSQDFGVNTQSETGWSLTLNSFAKAKRATPRGRPSVFRLSVFDLVVEEIRQFAVVAELYESVRDVCQQRAVVRVCTEATWIA